MSTKVEVSRRISASPETVYGLVADVTRMGDWSPETTSCRWSRKGGGLEVGARFRGTNRNRWHRWVTLCRVTAAEPDREFAFDSKLVFPIANWAYRIESIESGCLVTETWTDRRNAVFRRLGWMADGVRDRAVHNEEGMKRTLERLAIAAESEQPRSS